MKNASDYEIVNVAPMPEHEYSQCKILVRKDGTILLQSYNTIVCSIDTEGWLDCSGLYSRTTIKHIGWFMRNYGNGCSYYDAKYAWKNSCVVNTKTGEVLSYDEYNKIVENVA